MFKHEYLRRLSPLRNRGFILIRTVLMSRKRLASTPLGANPISHYVGPNVQKMGAIYHIDKSRRSLREELLYSASVSGRVERLRDIGEGYGAGR